MNINIIKFCIMKASKKINISKIDKLFLQTLMVTCIEEEKYEIAEHIKNIFNQIDHSFNPAFDANNRNYYENIVNFLH